ncbi:MAG: ParB/RepB/Spo0J family partition protein [Clostridiales bacterium]|jgi:ParB family chromosome partitioning protein|nr:ParB/RepB/Spo0J family partition protein [Clostridiales bacterium]
MAKRGLGKGLDALLSSYGEVEGKQENGYIKEIKINQIDPNTEQPRKKFDQDKINELAESIKQHGVVQPIIVKPNKDRYLIIVGERRWRAARLAGLTHIPAIVRDVDKKEIVEIALVENIQREDLNPIEEARGIKQLIDEHGLTQEEVAERIGWSRPAVTNALRLLTLSDEIVGYIEDGVITSGHARALLIIKDEKMRIQLAKKIIENNLSVRETENLAKKINEEKTENKDKRKKEKPGYIKEIEERLEEYLGTKVIITHGRKKGIIQIEYYSDIDLERIMERMKQ